MENKKDFVAGLQITKKDGTVVNFEAKTEMEYRALDSLALAFGIEANQRGHVEAILLALPRETGITVGIAGSGIELLKAFAHVKEALVKQMGPAADFAMTMVEAMMKADEGADGEGSNG